MLSGVLLEDGPQFVRVYGEQFKEIREAFSPTPFEVLSSRMTFLRFPHATHSLVNRTGLDPDSRSRSAGLKILGNGTWSGAFFASFVTE